MVKSEHFYQPHNNYFYTDGILSQLSSMVFIHPIQAYRKYGQRLLDQEIVLIIHGRYMTEWWETAYEHVNSSCTREEVMTALHKTFAITPETYALMENSSAVSYSGMVRYIEH